MSKPAARIGDMHVCPMVTPGVPPIPHVGGPVTGPGCPTVLIGGMPAAVMGDMCVCTGPPDTIILGSVGVMIGGKPAARMGDMCAHGGTIVLGCPTVLIGEIMPSPVTPPVYVPDVIAVVVPPLKVDPKEALKEAKNDPVVLQATAMNAAFATKQSRMNALIDGAENGDATVHKHNEEECKVQYEISGMGDEPAKDVRYEIKTNDGKVFSGTTGADGKTQQLSGYTEGECSISFPD